jgi:hypothetical protein
LGSMSQKAATLFWFSTESELKNFLPSLPTLHIVNESHLLSTWTWRHNIDCYVCVCGGACAVVRVRWCVCVCVCASIGLWHGDERKGRTCSWIAWLRTFRRTSRWMALHVDSA